MARRAAAARRRVPPRLHAVGRRRARRHRGRRLSRAPADVGRGGRGQGLPYPARRLPPQEVGGRRAAGHQADAGRDPGESQEPDLSAPHLGPRHPGYAHDDIVECLHPVPELEALLRQTMVLHNQYRWDRSQTRLCEVGRLEPDDYVVVFSPRNDEVLSFIRRVKSGRHVRRVQSVLVDPRPPKVPVPPVNVRARFAVQPRLEALDVYVGECVCSNDDLIRNAAYCWSPMTAEAIRRKTGIEERRYTELALDHISLIAARRALARSGRRPEEIGAVVFCSCTNTKTMPSLATWLSGQLGMFQTHASCDLVAACAGLPYGLAEAVRLLQEVERPVLVVCGEKFSDKIGTVRTSRMIFGDGAAALVVGPAPAGQPADVEWYQTYASGPMSEVDAIVWPNPAFDNHVTVLGPEVQALVGRYLTQMMDELRALPHPDGAPGSLLEAIDLVVPHQANKTMITELARQAGIEPERLYFNIERVGNTSSASIPIAIRDAVRDGIIDRPMRIFAPGFGAGAVAGYVVMRIDPAIVA